MELLFEVPANDKHSMGIESFEKSNEYFTLYNEILRENPEIVP